jgi:hygromycin-B 7''-O-kinase
VNWTPPVVPADAELRPSHPLETWLDAARAIAARHALEGEPLLFPTGSDLVFKVGSAVIKLTLPRFAAEIATEASTLRSIRLSVRTPEVIATGDLAGWPYVIMTLVPGEPLGRAWQRSRTPERLLLARNVGALARELHSLPVPASEEPGWAAFLAEMRRTCVARHARRGASPEWLARIEPFLEGVRLSERPLAMLHTELLDQHVLVEGLRPCGLIDFADSRVGHPFYDLPALVEFVFKGEGLGAFFEGYGDRADPLEVVAWGLLHRFGSLPRTLACSNEDVKTFEDLAERLMR